MSELDELWKELESELGATKPAEKKKEQPKKEPKPAEAKPVEKPTEKPELPKAPEDLEAITGIKGEELLPKPAEEKPKEERRRRTAAVPSKEEIPSPETFPEMAKKFETPKPAKVGEFVIEEEQAPPPKYVILIYGDKGTGKTTVAFSFPGTIACLSFDRKSAIIKATRYGGDPRIHVFNAVKYMDYSNEEAMLQSALKTYDYIMTLLDYIAEHIKPDWIVIDGAEILQQICEWKMRAEENIGPFEGIRNLNLWKKRRMYLRNVHYRAVEIARRGVIYTTYTTKDQLVIDGELVTVKDVPKWIDVLIFETDIVLHTEIDVTQRRFYVKVCTSKNDRMMPTGARFDVTDKNFIEVLKKHGYGEGL